MEFSGSAFIPPTLLGRHDSKGETSRICSIGYKSGDREGGVIAVWRQSGDNLAFPRVRHHSKQRRRWVGVKGSTSNGRRDPKCPSVRHLRIVREDPWAPSEGATCTCKAGDETVGCTRAFLTMWQLSRRLVCRGCLQPGLRVNAIFRIHWSQHLLTTLSERPN
ncbi:uncharacterized protein TNCV_1037221 [Trichonephila clavipes]|nr:uncharacterized protein TNCV_1037221 [Trichonephila clavipes]